MSKLNKLPTSRAVRTATIGKVVAGQAMRHASSRFAARNLDGEEKQVLLDRRQADAIKALVDGLGTMRGAAMKIGQMLSVIDLGVIPEDAREEFQRSLAKLRDAAPTVPFDKMRKLIETDTGGKLKDIFAEFDTEPIAAASIGQVYRARLHDGRAVAVKVQYPGVDKAVRADIKNLNLVTRGLKFIAPAMDMAAITTEIQERVEEELDYELEAQNQRKAARIYRDHPYIVVPDVLTHLSGPHVLVTEFFEGIGFEEVREADQATRDRLGEIMFRFYVGGMVIHRQFSGDPHPGNFRLGADGRVAFLDFGLYKHLDVRTAENLVSLQRASADKDAAGVHAVLADMGYLPDASKASLEDATRLADAVLGWITTDQDIKLVQEVANQMVADFLNPTADGFALIRQHAIPADQLMPIRNIVMVLAALGQLESSNNWHRIAREWLFGDAPVTELGRLQDESEWGKRNPLKVAVR